MSNHQPLYSVFLVLDPSRQEHRSSTALWLVQILGRCNWRSHLWLMPSSEPGPGWTREVAEVVSDHLERFRLCHLTLHPLVMVNGASATDAATWAQMLEPARPFQEEAYREQGEARLVVAPVLVAATPDAEQDLATALAFFADRLAQPVLLCDSQSSLDPEALALARRVMVAPGQRGGMAAVAEQLRAHHIFDSLIAQVDDEAENLAAPCRHHLVVDATGSVLAPCMWAWQRAESLQLLDLHHPENPLPEPLPTAACSGCMAASMAVLPAGLRAGGRRAEGHRVSLRLAMDLADRALHHQAASAAVCAEQLAADDQERAAALLHRALCQLEAGSLDAADEALLQAASCGAAAGTVAYHRARVQVAWRDDIVALDHFATALECGPEAVSAAELHFEMALSHIRIEEYREAAAHLADATVPGREPEVAFLAGVCELNQGRPERGLVSFDHALHLGPEPDDLARVLLYRATCLKELERFAEAIETLQQARTADPHELAVVNLLGFCHYSLGQHQEAVSCFEAAITIDPSSAIDWANLGSNLRDLGRTGDAVAAYHKALALDPSIGFARENVARLLEQD